MPQPTPNRKLLERYRQFRDTPPTFGKLMIANGVNLGPIFLLTMIGAVVVMALDLTPGFAWFIVGCGWGVFCSWAKIFRSTVGYWPTVSQVLDWGKIDELLKGTGESEN